ncbi:MAG: acetoin utilization protein AcuC [Desulfobacterales bacterium]|nr:acetoin utilization protein AcuC [Desulfobacterales bacterium]
MNTGFIYTDAYLDYDYGPTHPLRIIRLKLTYGLIKSYGLLDLPSVQFIPTIKAEEKDLAAFHSEEYLNILKQANEGYPMEDAYFYGLGPGDNPIFPGLFNLSLLLTGATLQAVDFVADGKGEIAFNIAGGLHHAMRARASGFCYINDPVIGIMRLLNRGKRVAYIDIDAHHGDGVQKAFYETNQVLTISLHESGHTLFPGTGFEYEIGEGEGEGYSVNLPFPPHTEDEVYVRVFDEVVPELVHAFKPDVVVTQLGVDTFYDDPLTNLHLSIFGFERILKKIKNLAPRWIALGGGGYNISNVARAWTLAWAVMNGIELNEKLPESFLKEAVKFGMEEKELRGRLGTPPHSQNKENRMEMERVVHYIKETVLPRVKG